MPEDWRSVRDVVAAVKPVDSRHVKHSPDERLAQFERTLFRDGTVWVRWLLKPSPQLLAAEVARAFDRGTEHVLPERARKGAR